MKEFLKSAKPKSPMAIYILKIGVLMMLAYYIFALIVQNSWQTFHEPFRAFEIVQELFACAPSFFSVAFIAAVIAELCHREKEQSEDKKE